MVQGDFPGVFEATKHLAVRAVGKKEGAPGEVHYQVGVIKQRNTKDVRHGTLLSVSKQIAHDEVEKPTLNMVVAGYMSMRELKRVEARLKRPGGEVQEQEPTSSAISLPAQATSSLAGSAPSSPAPAANQQNTARAKLLATAKEAVMAALGGWDAASHFGAELANITPESTLDIPQEVVQAAAAAAAEAVKDWKPMATVAGVSSAPSSSLTSSACAGAQEVHSAGAAAAAGASTTPKKARVAGSELRPSSSSAASFPGVAAAGALHVDPVSRRAASTPAGAASQHPSLLRPGSLHGLHSSPPAAPASLASHRSSLQMLPVSPQGPHMPSSTPFHTTGSNKVQLPRLPFVSAGCQVPGQQAGAAGAPTISTTAGMRAPLMLTEAGVTQGYQQLSGLSLGHPSTQMERLGAEQGTTPMEGIEVPLPPPPSCQGYVGSGPSPPLHPQGNACGAMGQQAADFDVGNVPSFLQPQLDFAPHTHQVPLRMASELHQQAGTAWGAAPANSNGFQPQAQQQVQGNLAAHQMEPCSGRARPRPALLRALRSGDPSPASNQGKDSGGRSRGPGSHAAAAETPSSHGRAAAAAATDGLGGARSSGGGVGGWSVPRGAHGDAGLREVSGPDQQHAPQPASVPQHQQQARLHGVQQDQQPLQQQQEILQQQQQQQQHPSTQPQQGRASAEAATTPPPPPAAAAAAGGSDGNRSQQNPQHAAAQLLGGSKQSADDANPHAAATGGDDSLIPELQAAAESMPVVAEMLRGVHAMATQLRRAQELEAVARGP